MLISEVKKQCCCHLSYRLRAPAYAKAVTSQPPNGPVEEAETFTLLSELALDTGKVITLLGQQIVNHKDRPTARFPTLLPADSW